MTHFYFVAATLFLAAVVSAYGAQMRAAEIIDPISRAKAYSYTIPDGWLFEGAIVAGSSCVATPSPVFRLTSPDQITEMRMLPRFDWTWWDQPKPPSRQEDDCLALDKEITATDFLKAMAGILGVTIVREDPLPNHAELQAKMRLQTTGPRMDNARYVVRYTVNRTPVEEDLTVKTLCMSSTGYTPYGSYPFHTCTAWVSRARTHEGQLMDLRNMFAGIERSLVMDQQWNKSWASVMGRRSEQAGPGTAAREKLVKDARGVRQRQYADFLAAREGKAASPHSGDWTDFVLGGLKVRK
jgi:hypothetical protein